jgi:lysophospholipase L1-like esterase
MSTKRRSAGSKLLLATVAFTLTLAVVEGGSRLALLALGESEPSGVRFVLDDVWQHEDNPFHEEDPLLMWRLVPGLSNEALRVNALGFRGGDVEIPKPNGTFRIVALGDSMTFGFGVFDDQTYAARLAERLSDRGRVEVVNAGVTGYSSWQSRKYYETVVRRLDPDLVVAMFGYPDHHFAVESDREKYDRRTAQAAWNLVRKSGAYRMYRRIAGVEPPRLRREPVPRVGLEEFRENVLAVQKMAEDDGARVLFLTVPLRREVPFVENFRAVREDGGTVWLRQLDFAISRLGPESSEPLAGHFLGSRELGAFVHDPRHCDKIRSLSVDYPDFPIFHYLLAACYRSYGDLVQARGAMDECRRLDRERFEMEAYNDALRELSAASRIELLDLARILPERAGATNLFLDVAHPTPEGHDLIAEILSERIVPR